MKTKQNLRSLAVAIAFVGMTAFATASDKETEQQLLAEATVTKGDAEKTALSKVPGGTVKEVELEKENGKLVWSFDIAMPKSENITEVQVDAKSGQIVKTEIETPKDKAKEAAEDKEGKKGK